MARERCSNCEEKVDKDDKYCPNCGANVHMQRLQDIRENW